VLEWLDNNTINERTIEGAVKVSDQELPLETITGTKASTWRYWANSVRAPSHSRSVAERLGHRHGSIDGFISPQTRPVARQGKKRQLQVNATSNPLHIAL
jgi:hypothetical protein